jgi:hypothetical protein
MSNIFSTVTTYTVFRQSLQKEERPGSTLYNYKLDLQQKILPSLYSVIPSDLHKDPREIREQ